jgi:hypothetical protein
MISTPKLRKLDQIGKISVWEVDGKAIRDNKDEEFTNFGSHETNSYIPANEFWLDKEASPDEHQFFVQNLLSLRKHMAAGKTYEQARKLGNMAESRERNKLSPGLKGSRAGVYKQLIGKSPGKPTIWQVHGDKVRKQLKTDFTEGGHGLVYPFIPKNEVWLDDDLGDSEVKHVLTHELHERNLMRTGMKYNKAHAAASKLEALTREKPGTVDAALQNELMRSGVGPKPKK